MHTAAIKSDGSLWAWGNGVNNAPVRIGVDTNWISIFAGDNFTLALKSDSTLWGWGANTNGELGDGSTQSWAEPHQVMNVIGPGNSLVINNGANFTSSAVVTLQVFASDEASSITFMQFSNDGTTWTAPEAYATSRNWILIPGDGAKAIYVMFQDAAGNWSTAQSASIILDTTAPAVTIASPIASTINTMTPTLTYTVSDGTVVVKVDGAVVSKVSGTTLAPLTDGGHTVRVEATDAANNTGFAEVTFKA